MKPPDFDYVAPRTVPEAVAALASDPDARVLAGGQSLIPMLAFRLVHPSLLVDLAHIDGLDRIVEEDGRVTIGTMTRQRRAEHDPVLAKRCALLTEALTYVGHSQIRSRGTIGGSVAHADPAAELPAVVLALDGQVRVSGPHGERIIGAADFFQGFLTTALQPGEILTEVSVVAAGPRTGCSVVEVARRPGDYALCGALCQVETRPDGSVSGARLALIGVGDRPVRARSVEAAMLGGASPAEAAVMATDGLAPRDDAQASADYRLHLAEVLSRRALSQALDRAR